MENLERRIKEADLHVRAAHDRLGDGEGENVTLEQIRGLLASRLRALSLRVQDPASRQEDEFGHELMKYEMGIKFSWQEELEVLRQAQGIDTPSQAIAAKTWFTKAKVPMNAVNDVIRSNPKMVSVLGNMIIENKRRNKVYDAAVRVLDQTFKP